MIAFGADGLLYLGMGDGGGANDQHGPIGNGQALDTLRVANLRKEGFIELTEDGRLRVTHAGFPILDAVVADLAA